MKCGSRVKLREFTYNDQFRLVEIANNPNIAKNMNVGFPNPYTLEDAKTFLNKIIEPKIKTVFAILYNGFYVGNIGLFLGKDENKRTAEIAYFVDQKYWNKGIATKAIKLITRYGFKKLKLFLIQAGVFKYNTSSMKVLEKSGFSKDGIFKTSSNKNNQIINKKRYTIINPNLTQIKNEKNNLLAIMLFVITIVTAQEKKSDVQIIKETIQTSYVEGIQNEGDAKKIDAGFHPDFYLLGIDKGDEMWRYSIKDWKAKSVKKRENGTFPLTGENKVSVKFITVDITGKAAIVKLEYYRGEKLTFVDYITLYKFESGWKIVSKIFHKF